MRAKNYFWKISTVSMALALAVPAFAQSQHSTPSMSEPSGTSSSDREPMNTSQSGEAGKADRAVTQADHALNQRIRQALSGDSTLAATAQKIQLESDNGNVTLHGAVATSEQEEDIVAKVSQVAGVKKVNTQLKVGA